MASTAIPKTSSSSLPVVCLATAAIRTIEFNSQNAKEKENKISNPITEFKKQVNVSVGGNTVTNLSPHMSTSQIPQSPTTKIPHPLAVANSRRHQNTFQFRRIGSLRLRGKKSNLPYFITEGEDESKMECEMETTSKLESNQLVAHNILTGHNTSTRPRKEIELNSFDSVFGVRNRIPVRNYYNQIKYTTDQSDGICTTGVGDNQHPTSDECLQLTDAEQQSSNDSQRKSPTNGHTMIAEQGVDKIIKDTQHMSLNLNGSATSPIATVAETSATTAKSIISKANANANGKSATSGATPIQSARSVVTQNIQFGKSKQKPGTQLIHHGCLATVPETKLSPKTPPVTPDSPSTYLEDDLDSLYSFATTTSGRSTMSCDHPYVARNGTTFSGRKMKYVVHCSAYAGQVGSEYLTPTQRAQRQIRRLKELLYMARQDLEHKDSEMVRLTREVVELRLFKASLSSPEERSASSDAVTVREAELKTSQDVSPIVDMVDEGHKASPRHIASSVGHYAHHNLHNHLQHEMHLSSEMQSSFADSGHFEDMTSSSIHSKDSYAVHTHDVAIGCDDIGDESSGNVVENYELQRQELIRLYEQRIEELIRNQDTATSEMKRNQNDRIEALLQKLAECNTRYADIVPDYEHAKERIRELEKQLEDLQRKLVEHEEKQNKMYLHMYQKGQEAERISRADQALELAHRSSNAKVSIHELLHQLQSTQDELENIRAAECRNECGSNHALLTAKEAVSLWVLGARKTIYRRLLEAQKNHTRVDPEVTLQFLKSAIYYFLTDKENSKGHLQAIQSILEFTEVEKQNINKAQSAK